MRTLKWLGLTVIFMVWVPKARLDTDKQSQFSMEIALCGKALARNIPENALFGKIQVVDSFPDVKVKVVNSFPDIKVQWVQSCPKPGQWQAVDAFPDYAVQFVQSFPDYTIQIVESFPGCR